MSMTPSRAVPGILVLFASPLAAQAEGPDRAAAAGTLRKALQQTAALPAIAFKSVESRDEAMMRHLPIGAAEDVQVSGTLADGVLHASIGYDDDEVVLADGRMIARQQDGAWKLRRGCLADGKPLPFVLDPSVLLGVLARLPESALQVTRVEPAKLKDRDVMLYSTTLTGAAAEELGLCGAMPRGGGRMMVMIGGAGAPQPKAEVTVDLAVSVDPATGHVLRVHAKSYAKSELPGNVQVRFAGADGVEFDSGEAEEEAADEAGQAGPLEYSKGLPKRKLDKKTSLTEFDVSFSQHGEAKKPELTDAARALLGR
jgi:hypothetical protein